MRCEFLVLILAMRIVLVASAQPANKTKASFNQKKAKNTSFCQINLKSSKVASNAASEAKAAKDAQKCESEAASQQAMDRLASKAEQAARVAEAALNGKKVIIEQLEHSQCEADAVIEEVKKALEQSRCNIETVTRVSNVISQLLELMKALVDEAKLNVVKVQEVAGNAHREVDNKQKQINEIKKGIEKLKICLQKTKEDLERTRCTAKQAETSAEEARQRIGTVHNIFKKIKKLQRRDMRALKAILNKIIKET